MYKFNIDSITIQNYLHSNSNMYLYKLHVDTKGITNQN